MSTFPRLSKNEIGVSIVLIRHNNTGKFQTRLERDIIPTIEAHPEWKFQLIVIDNSDEEDRSFLEILERKNIPTVYRWPGTNIMYGPAMNLALKTDVYPIMVYVCTNHGRMYHTSWIDDLIAPIMNNPLVAMTGSFYNSCHPSALGFPSHLRPVHIQGGVFAASTEVMKKYPYSTDQRWIHWGSDVYQSFQLLNAGYLLEEVATVKSVWRQNLTTPHHWKYVHDNSEEC